MYMANTSPTARVPNVNHIPLAHVESARLGVGSARLGVGSARLGVGFLDTNMLVSTSGNGRVGGLNQHNGESFRVSVEYRL